MKFTPYTGTLDELELIELDSTFSPYTGSLDDLDPVAAGPEPAKSTGGVGEFLADLGKRAAGAVTSGLASIPEALQSGLRSTVRSGAAADPSTLMPAGAFIPGVDTDEAITGLQTQRERDRQDLNAERMAAKVRLPGAESLARAGRSAQEAINKTTSQTTQDAVANSQITGNLLKGEIDFGKDPSVRGFLMQGADVFGSMLPVAATALLTRRPSAAGAVGGAMAGGEGVENAREFIAKQSDEDLMRHSPLFGRMIEAGASPQEARRIVSARAEDTSALMQGAIASVGDRFTGSLVTGGLDSAISRMAGRSIAGRVVAGAGVSSAEQGAQELAEGVASDIGTASVAGNKEIGEDSAANFVLGALGGAAPGAGRGLVSGVQDRRSTPAAAAPAPRQEPTIDVTYEAADGRTVTEVIRPGAPDPLALGQAIKDAAPEQAQQARQQAVADIGAQTSVDDAISAATRAVSINDADLADRALRAAGIDPQELSALEAQARAEVTATTRPAPAQAERAAASDSTAAAAAPERTWYGRRGDGYQSLEDAERGLTERWRAQPLLDWRIEQTEGGRFRLAGYAQDANAEPLTFEQKRELARARAQTELARADAPTAVPVQTQPATSMQDVQQLSGEARARRDAAETREIEQMLERDAQAQQQSQAERQAVAQASQQENIQGQQQDIARRTRQRMVADLTQAYGERAEGYASRALPAIERQLQALQQPPLTAAERVRVKMLLGSARALASPRLPSDVVRAVDRNADNAEMEALIRERRPRPSTPSGVANAAQQPQVTPVARQQEAAAAALAGRAAAGAPQPAAAAAPTGGGGLEATGLTAGPVEPPARPQASARARTAGDGLRARSWDANPMRAFLAKHGVNLSSRSEFAPGLREMRGAMVPGYGPIFRGTGKPLDTLAQAAVEEGFLAEADEAQLYQLIDAAVRRGERVAPQYTSDYAEREMHAEMERRQQLDREQAEEAQAAADAELAEYEAVMAREIARNPLFDGIDAGVPLDTPASNISTEQAMRLLGFTEEEIHEQTQRDAAAEGAGRAPGAAADGPAARAAPAGDGRGEAPARAAGQEADIFALSAPSRGEVLARQQAQQEAEQSAARERQQQERRAQADSERDTFALTGSGRPADVAEAQGQRPMFSRSADTRAAYEARIDALFAGEKAAGPNQGARVLDRSDVLAMLGFGDGPVQLAEGKVIKGQANHPRMTAAQWKKVPEWLDNPAAVFDSDTVEGRLTMIAPETIDGNMVVLAIEPSGRGAKVHILVNAFDKDGGPPPVGRWLREGKARLIDQKGFPAVLGDSGLQLSSSAWQNKPGMRRILTEKHLAGYRRANDPAFSFAGARAATADTHALVTAQDRLAAGEDAETVRRETGWHRGADGRMRFEINDSDASYIGKAALEEAAEADPYKMAELPLSEVLQHPALFAAYPALREVRVAYEASAASGGDPYVGASYNPRDNVITLGNGLTEEEQLSALLHEVQHGIQTIEGFATGASMDDLAKTMPDAQAVNDAKLLARFMARGETAFEARQRFMQYMGRDPNPQGAYIAERYEPAEVARMAKDAWDGYKRSAGEVEARNTQARQKLTDEQRRATPPSSTADVADADVIVTFNGREMASAPMPANATGFDFEAMRRAVFGDAAAPARPRAAAPGATTTQVAGAIRRAYGNLLERLQAKGLVTLVQTEDEAVEAAAQARAAKTGQPVERARRALSLAMQGDDMDVRRSTAGAVEGFYDPVSGQSFLVADGLTEATAPGTLMHEVGIHMASDGTLEPLFERAQRILEMGRGHAFIDRVRQRMEAAGETSAEEAAAYIVTEYENGRAGAPKSVQRWVQDFIAAVRGWMFRRGVLVKASQLTVADIAAVARANARSLAGATMAPATGAQLQESQRATPDPFYDDLRRRVADGRGYSEDELFDALAGAEKSAGRRGYIQYRSGDGARLGGSATAFWEGQLAGQDGFYTAGVSTQIEGKPAFVMMMFPSGALQDGSRADVVRAYREKRYAWYMFAREESPGKWEVGTDGVGPEGVYHQALVDAGELTPAGGGYHRLQLPGGTSEFELLREGARRLSMLLDGQTPELRFRRDTGAKPGKTVAWLPARVEARFSRGGAAAGYDLPAEGWTAKKRRLFQDQFLRGKVVLEAVARQGGQVDEQTDFYGAEGDSYGRRAALVQDFRRERVEPLVAKLEKAGLELDELALYAYAKHAPERNAAAQQLDQTLTDNGSGMTDAEAQAVIAKARAEGKEQALEDARQDLMAMVQANRDMMLADGLITQAEYDRLNGMFQDYVPLRGFEQVDEDGQRPPGGMRAGKGYNVRGAETLKMMGRTSRAGQIIENIIGDYERTVDRAERNHVGKVFLNFVLANPDPQLWEVNARETRKALDRRTGQVERRTETDKGEDTVAVKVGGREIYITIHDELLLRAMRRAFTSDKGEVDRMLVRHLGFYSRLLRDVLTRYNPEFAAVNAVRDFSFGALAITADLGEAGAAKFTAHYPGALAAGWRFERNKQDPASKEWDRYFNEYRMAGGMTAGFYVRGADEIGSDIQAMLRDLQTKGQSWSPGNAHLKALALTKGAGRALELLGSVSEHAARVSAFRTAREMGKSPAQAARIAKELTTNFDRKGELGQFMNAAYVFFNAAAQGAHKFAVMLQNPKVQRYMAGATAGMITLALLSAELGGDDPDDGMAYWDKIPDYVKERNIVIMLPPGDQTHGAHKVGTKGRYLLVPIQYGPNIFTNLGYQVADVIRHARDPMRGRSLAKASVSIMSTIAGTFNPVAGSVDLSSWDEVALAGLPTIFDLPYQLGAGVNAFGRPSAPYKSPFDTRPDSENVNLRQQDAPAHKVARGLNKITGGSQYESGLIDVAPGTLETLLRGFTGGAGMFLYDSAILASKSIDIAMGGDPDLELRDVPIVRRVAGETGASVDESLLYERRQKIEEAAGVEKRMDEAGVELTDPEKLALASMGKGTRQTSKQLAAVRREMKEVQADEALTPEQKRDALRELRAERDEIVMEFNREFFEVMRDELRAAKE